MKRNVFIFLMIWHCVAFASIETKVTPLKAHLGDTIRVIYTMGDAAGVRPDLSPLKKEFNIVGTQQSMSYSVVNGQAHAITQWIILLTAKQKGVLAIPAIHIGKHASNESSVEILDAASTSTQEDSGADFSGKEALLLKTDVSNPNPYINEQVIYTVKLYHNQRLVDADYRPPVIEDALLFPLGDGQSYQSVYNGQVYAVEEQKYAVFPQKSGTLRLVAPTFEALVYSGRPERVKAFAKTTELNVKPVPPTHKGQSWFPAKQVKLTEVYSNQDPVIVSGSTLVRTVTLQAIGVPAQLLPQLTFEANDKIRVYPEKPDIDNVIRQNELVSKTVVKVTYLFNQTGEAMIPALSLKWFNTVTGKEEVETLPKRRIDVRTKSAEHRRVVNQPAIKERSVVQKAPFEQSITSVPTDRASTPWITASLLGAGWFITLIIWWFSHHSRSPSRGKRIALSRLKDACIHNQPVDARAALIQWAKLHWPDANILNITDLSRVVHDAMLKKQLSLLSHALYSQDGKITWRGDALWHSVSKHRTTQVNNKQKGNSLPPINPF